MLPESLNDDMLALANALFAAAARRDDPPTSQQAAESLTPVHLERLEQDIVDTLRRNPRGLTASEIATSLDVPRDSVSPRMRGLVARGRVKESGTKRPGPSGRAQTVWAAV